MVTGVETAGLVLAIIPLLISALEHYEDGLEPTIAFFKWDKELSTAIRKLWYQHTSYEQSIRLLLTPITTNAELQEMMECAGSALWKDGELADQLRDKLGKAFNPYLYTVQEIEELMKSLAEMLNIEGSNEVSDSDSQFLHLHAN